MSSKRISCALSILLSLSVASGVQSQIHDPRAIEADPATAQDPIAPVLDGLGEHHIEVTTTNPRSQYFFDQGLRLTYGFNHSEALRAFKEAVRLDPDNAMAYWGWALVLGPNLNLPMQPEVVEQAWSALQMAVARKELVSARERAYIEALEHRFAAEVLEDRSLLDTEYATAMEELVEEYPDDLDAATLYAAALMNLSPWDYWYLDGRPKENAEQILEVLESVTSRDPNHPGAIHYYIHAVEARHPEKGVEGADRLVSLMPGAGHMVHMPSHIYMRIGRYADSYEVNRIAAEVDEEYIAQCRAQGLYPLGYFPHNIHFMAWAAMFQGRSAQALAASRRVAEKIPEELVGNAFGLYETFLSQPIYTMVRFGDWTGVLEEPEPAEEARFMRGAWHYARALAYVNAGDSSLAATELEQLEVLRDAVQEEEYAIGFGAAGTLLTIGSEIVHGEMAAATSDYPEALSHLERAVRLEDSLLYNEPPDWYFPVRHILGAVLLEAGRASEAEVVYWQDLRKNPDNGYALFGLAQSLRAQKRHDEAAEATERFEMAWSEADHELRTSRF